MSSSTRGNLPVPSTSKRRLSDAMSDMSINDRPRKTKRRKPTGRDRRRLDAKRAEKNAETIQREVVDRHHKQYGPPPVPIPKGISFRSVSITLPVSTRALGFAVQYLYQRFSTGVNPIQNFNISIHQFYRATLLQFELQMHRAQSHRFSMYHESGDLEVVGLSPEEEQLIVAFPDNFSMITNIINNFGSFKLGELEYNVTRRIPHDSRTVPDPLSVDIRNLRETVEDLSDPDFDEDEAVFFMDHNPIPGLEIEDDAVINPDEVIPAEYGLLQMRDDLQALRDCLYQVARKVPADVEKCTFSGIGSSCQLVSCELNNDRIVPTIYRLTGRARRRTPTYGRLATQIRLYHAVQPLTDQNCALGILGLYGEFSRHDNMRYWGLRAPQVCASSAYYDWNSLSDQFAERRSEQLQKKR